VLLPGRCSPRITEHFATNTGTITPRTSRNSYSLVPFRRPLPPTLKLCASFARCSFAATMDSGRACVDECESVRTPSNTKNLDLIQRSFLVCFRYPNLGLHCKCARYIYIPASTGLIMMLRVCLTFSCFNSALISKRLDGTDVGFVYYDL
jgi:hypothetical protein